MRNDDRQIVGGIVSHIHWHDLHVDFLRVDESLKGQGYGRILLENVFIEVNNKHNVYTTGDAEKLRQCLLNIIKNSIESIENEGKITISLDERHGMAIILIKDTGVGMNKEQVKRLGTPYFSMKDKGTGLGLMVVFSLIKAMNGKIKVESEIGKGTCFTITIPTVEYTSDKDK